MAVLTVLLLLGVANGAPILAGKLLGEYLAYPIDGGIRYRDGRPLFGASKTVRGVLAAVVLTAVAADLLGLSLGLGALLGILAMLGDLIASFVKRRLGLAPSSMYRGLDQIPESLLPTLAAAPYLDLTAIEIMLAVTLFFFLEMMLSPLLFKLRIRERPY
jgi:CDP-2,3-bis-(O-geranylgeranyl)-sn-glycerol synthase